MNERIWKLLQKEWLADNKKQTALRSILKIDEWIQQILNAWLEELMNLLDNNIYFDTTTKDYKTMNWFLIKAERRGDKSFQGKNDILCESRTAFYHWRVFMFYRWATIVWTNNCMKDWLMYEEPKK